MVPIPDPSYFDDCEYLGAPGGRKRWRRTDKKHLYEWDSLHGEIEVYNLRGEHLFAADPLTGIPTKPPRRGRTIDV